MMAEQVKPGVFNLPCHKLTTNIQNELDALLKEYESQFTKDEISIGTTSLTSMTIDTGDTDPVSQKPYPIAMKHYQWVKEEIEKLLAAKVIHSSRSSWSAPIIVVPKVIEESTWYSIIDLSTRSQGNSLGPCQGRRHIL